MSKRIVVVDYHKGNLLSVARSVTEAGGDAVISDDPADIRAADGVIVPGVGAFEDAMAYVESSGEGDAIRDAVGGGVPFLGICLGLHLLFERGDELGSNHVGDDEWARGLGILKGSVTRLESSRLKVPHVGWDQIHLTPHGRECPLLAGVSEGANVYFTHSYAVADDVDPGIVATRTHYARSFPSGVWQDNVFGVQFHPEKSSRTGLGILRNYVRMVQTGDVSPLRTEAGGESA